MRKDVVKLLEPCLARCFFCDGIKLCKSKQHWHKETIRMEEVDVRYIYYCGKCQ